MLESTVELKLSLGARLSDADLDEAARLVDIGLPPVVSTEALAVMLGVNSGLIWSFVQRPARHYRVFEIPKGKDTRTITAPRVGLKVFQHWLAHHLSRAYLAPDHVFGFVPGRNYIDAARAHVGADWAWSFDINNFFGTTPRLAVRECYSKLGYGLIASELLTSLTTFGGSLPQGAPTSPVLSNLAFAEMDGAILALAADVEATVTRYADDIVFSGRGAAPEGFRSRVYALFDTCVWSLNSAKNRQQPLRGRIKVHGLLVQETEIKLTKGYRNKLRAYKHIVETRGDAAINLNKLKGHLSHARQIDPNFRVEAAAQPKTITAKTNSFIRFLRRVFGERSPPESSG